MKAPCGFFPLASIGGINDSSLLPWAGSLSQVCLRISAWNSWTPCQHWILAPMHRQQTKKKKRKLMAGTPKNGGGWKMVFFPSFFLFQLRHFQVPCYPCCSFSGLCTEFSDLKKEGSPYHPGEFLRRFDTAKSCWPRDSLLNFPIDPKLGDLLGQRISTMMSNMVK